MKNLIKTVIKGTLINFGRIFFVLDRVTDKQMRNDILSGNVKPEVTVDESGCIGCSGCANVCPTQAIEMKPLAKPVKIAEGWIKKEVPEINKEKCVVCYHCHDFCPLYALYGLKGAVHPNAVGDFEVDVSSKINEPIKISEDKLKYISQYLSDQTILKNKK